MALKNEPCSLAGLTLGRACDPEVRVEVDIGVAG
jgi:hypothetical protein